MDIPCQVNVLFSTKGDIEPQWVRFRNVDGEIETIKITMSKQTNRLPSNTVFFHVKEYMGLE